MTQLPRPQAMHIEPALCTECGLCDLIAPGIRHDPQRIPVTPDTLEAMAQCPTGALRWREDDPTQDTGPERSGSRLEG